MFSKADQLVKLISLGTFGPEDWSNDAENSALHHRNKLYLKKKKKKQLICEDYSELQNVFILFPHK